jgi:hypothetical protein
MKIFAFGLILILFSMNSYSQGFGLEYNLGMGQYKMAELKEINSQLITHLPFHAEVTEDFPVFVNHKFYVTYSFRKLVTIGAFYTYNSTGSRVSYSDYSGEYRFDNVISSHQPGFDIRFKLYDNKFSLFLYSDAGYSFSNLDISEYFRLLEMEQSQSLKLYAGSWQAELGARAAYKWKMLAFGLFVGYAYDFKSTLHTKENKEDIYFNYYTNSEVTEDWSGLRFGLSAGILFK